jgi:hypothetical protein
MKKAISLVLLCVFFVQGCATYRAGVLPSKDVFTYDNRQEKDNLYVAANILDIKETKRIFQFDLQSKGVQPIYIVIDNRGKQTYEFSKANLNKNALSSQEVAEKCKFSTVGRATTYGIAGLFIWPLLIPAVVDGVGSANANKRIEDDYAYKEITDKARIQPNGMLTGVVFVEKMKPGEDFTMRLLNMETNDLALFSFRQT